MAVLPDMSNVFDENLSAEERRHNFYENGDRLMEAIFYGDTGAYEYQFTNLTRAKYKLDRDWLSKNKGLDIDLVESFAISIRNILHDRVNSPTIKFGKYAYSDFELFIFSKRELLGGNHKYNSILDLLVMPLNGMANIQLKSLGDYNEIYTRPIIQLSTDRYFVTSTFQASRALYETPFYWMIEDESYRPTAQKNRGEIAEQIVYQKLITVFGIDAVYRNVLIKENRQKTITDIDVLLLHQQTAVIFQIKSKRLTLLSRQGDIKAIKRDIEAAFGDAYHKQGLVAREILLNKKNSYRFDNIPFESIITVKDCVVVVVTLDFYPAMMAQISSLIDANEECSPIGISIFDLENIITTLKTKDRIVSYFLQRAMYSKHFIADNEMAMLAFYLKYGLKRKDNLDVVYLDNSWAKDIDIMLRANHLKGLEQLEINRRLTDVTIKAKKKIGRNDMCICGSGLKYKNCHGK